MAGNDYFYDTNAVSAVSFPTSSIGAPSIATIPETQIQAQIQAQPAFTPAGTSYIGIPSTTGYAVASSLFATNPGVDVGLGGSSIGLTRDQTKAVALDLIDEITPVSLDRAGFASDSQGDYLYNPKTLTLTKLALAPSAPSAPSASAPQIPSAPATQVLADPKIGLPIAASADMPQTVTDPKTGLPYSDAATTGAVVLKYIPVSTGEVFNGDRKVSAADWVPGAIKMSGKDLSLADISSDTKWSVGPGGGLGKPITGTVPKGTKYAIVDAGQVSIFEAGGAKGTEGVGEFKPLGAWGTNSKMVRANIPEGSTQTYSNAFRTIKGTVGLRTNLPNGTWAFSGDASKMGATRLADDDPAGVRVVGGVADTGQTWIDPKDEQSFWDKPVASIAIQSAIGLTSILATFVLSEKNRIQAMKIARDDRNMQLEALGMQYAARGGGGNGGGGNNAQAGAVMRG